MGVGAAGAVVFTGAGGVVRTGVVVGVVVGDAVGDARGVVVAGAATDDAVATGAVWS